MLRIRFFFHHGSRVKRARNSGLGSPTKYQVFLTQKLFLHSQKYDPGRYTSSGFFHPGSRGQKTTGSQIRIRNNARKPDPENRKC
jgi:hypothetical protein